MTLKHKIKLVLPKLNWIKLRIKRFVLNYRKLKIIRELYEKGSELQNEYLELKRKNTDESNLFAEYKLQKIEIIKWILGEYGI